MERKRWDGARKKFLADELKRGPLSCKYCGKLLALKADKKHEQVTVDHVMPKSLGGDPFCSSNFAVSCNSCNHQKSSIAEDEFVKSSYIKMKRKHSS
jgi:5-methylcytosine-specific restriction endonuclease McrA